VTAGLGGRLLEFVCLAWEDDHMAAIDWSATRLNTGWLSGGERRLLEIADSLASGHPVNLADTLTGLDPANSQTVVDAVAHATGVQRWGYDR
jgi:alpha-D-ribose 1-methylphosphonate 5-triphosphate synthase subunit PhnL